MKLYVSNFVTMQQMSYSPLFHSCAYSAYLYSSIWSGLTCLANSTAAVMREQSATIRATVE